MGLGWSFHITFTLMMLPTFNVTNSPLLNRLLLNILFLAEPSTITLSRRVTTT